MSEVTEVIESVESAETAQVADAAVEPIDPAAGPGDDEDDEDDGEAGETEGAAKQAKAKLSPNLTGKQRRFLRAKAHHLSAVLHVGHEGVTDAVVKQCRVQLQAHELIKVKVAEMAPAGRHGTAEELAGKTGSELAQVLGRTFLLFKKRARDSKINLPK